MDFRDIQSLEELAENLSMKYDVFDRLIFKMGCKKKYIKFKIPKKNGKEREISAPIPPLKYLQREVADRLYEEIKFRKSVHGFVKGKSIKTNALQHINRKHILSIDLQDFFPSITRGRVFGLFKRVFGFNKQIANAFVRICCDDNGLTQGSPSSPVISNLICRNMDGDLIKFAEKYRLQYTRYADDLTFSSNSRIDNICYRDDKGMLKVCDELEYIIRLNGFTVNKDKLRIKTAKERQTATGIIVNKKLNLPKRYRDNIRAILNSWHRNEYKRAEEILREKLNRKNISLYKYVLGKINYLKYIKGPNDTQYNRLAKQFNFLKNAYKRNTKDLEVRMSQTEIIEKATWYIEDSATLDCGTGFFMKDYGFITCYHVLENNNNLSDLVIANPIYPGVKLFVEKMLAKDKNLDIAILKIGISEDVKLLEFDYDDNYNYKPRERIILSGYPNYNPSTESISIQEGTTVKKVSDNLFAISERIIGGNSGGPVLNGDLKVIGVAQRGLSSRDVRFSFPEKQMWCKNLQALKDYSVRQFKDYPDASSNYEVISINAIVNNELLNLFKK